MTTDTTSVDALRARLARAFEVAALRDPSAELAAFEAAVRREAEAEVANAFVAWAAKNEIAEPPLDWKWFGEIARRYSPLYGGGDDS